MVALFDLLGRFNVSLMSCTAANSLCVVFNVIKNTESLISVAKVTENRNLKGGSEGGTSEGEKL